LGGLSGFLPKSSRLQNKPEGAYRNEASGLSKVYAIALKKNNKAQRLLTELMRQNINLCFTTLAPFPAISRVIKCVVQS
jgi:hypothetical protein